MSAPGAITSMLGGQSAGQAAGPQGQDGKPGGGEDLIAVPAGLWGSLISMVSGVAGNLVGGQTGQTISSVDIDHGPMKCGQFGAVDRYLIK